jgi:predicted dehydrogenase
MKLKFAFLGSWHSHATMHVREAANRPDEVELLGMYDPDPAVIASCRERFAREGVVVPVIESEEAVLESDADAVIVEGHVYQNLDYAERALEAGKHVLLEKPAGVNLEQFQRIQRLANDKGLVLNLAYMWRYNPAIAETIRLAQSGALGQIYSYRGHIPKPKDWHPELDVEFKVYHGGAYFEMAGHLVDNMVALMGVPKSIHPYLRAHYGNRQVVDNAAVIHEYDDGLAIIDMGSMAIGSARRIEVHGTGGTAIHAPIGSVNLSLAVERNVDEYRAGGWQDIEMGETGSEWSLLREMRACIERSKEPDYSPEHDLAVQKILFEGCGVTDGNALR